LRRSPRRRQQLQQPEGSDPRINARIRVPRVLVIDEEGNRLGEFLTEDAVQLARDRALDLVEVAPNARPPVCRITDFGKLKYDRKKKAAAARRNQVQVQLKEVKLRPKTDQHDLNVKVGHTRRFLDEGNKVKVTVRFRGRELAHRDIGVSQCMRVAAAAKDLGLIESHPRMEGRQMFMILAPLKRPTKPKPTADAEDEFGDAKAASTDKVSASTDATEEAASQAPDAAEEAASQAPDAAEGAPSQAPASE